MINDAIQGKINLIITKEVSRFARNTVDTLNYVRMLKNSKYRVGILFINDNINTLDESSEFKLTLMASLAQEESRKTSERVKWGQKQSMINGVVFGKSLLGYTLKDGKLSINEDEKKLINIIFHKYTNEKKSTYKIANELNEKGYLTKNKNNFSSAYIYKILRNEKYVGDLCQKKTYTPDFIDHKKKYNKNTNEQIYIKNHHKPIISRQLWNDTIKEIKKRSSSNTSIKKYSNKYPFSGKIKCGICSSDFVTRYVKKGTDYNDILYWRCHLNNLYGNKGCNNNSIRNDVILFLINNILSKIKIDFEKITSELLNNINYIKNIDIIDIKNIEKQKEKLIDKKKKIINNMIEENLSKENACLMIDEYDKQITELNNKLLDCNKITYSQLKDSNAVKKKITSIINNKNIYNNYINNISYNLLENLIVCNNKKIIIYLSFFHYPIEIIYKASGKMDNYKISVEKFNILNSSSYSN